VPVYRIKVAHLSASSLAFQGAGVVEFIIEGLGDLYSTESRHIRPWRPV
jgi:hypothetical protein